MYLGTMMLVTFRRIAILCAAFGLTACAPAQRELLEQAPTLTPSSPTSLDLDALLPPARKLDIAVYNFPDLTGKNEPNANVAVFSRAVTQGGSGFAVDALQRAGHGRWFTVDERVGLNNLLQERQLIRATRAEFDGDDAKPLPPVRFAGLLLEGGILAFDANVVTGGAGANFLGIGATSQYQQDTVTVAMRVVSVQTGEILTSVTTTKTVYSISLDANVYKYVAFDQILQAEAGLTRTEPTQLAVRQAIDLAAYATIMKGVQRGLWDFADHKRGHELLEQYLAREVVSPNSPDNGPPKKTEATQQ